jgi:hypothetical protein
MIATTQFPYQPDEHELEKASNSYLMSLIAIMGGLPLPIINLIATLVFYLGNLRGTYFVRWHCIQALLSQLFLLPFNSVGFWWSISIIFTPESISNSYIAYILTIFTFNLIEFVGTIYTAVATRKGTHVEWWVIGGLTNIICKEK